MRYSAFRILAEALGGQAFAENVEGNGARVGVTMPVAPGTGEPSTEA